MSPKVLVPRYLTPSHCPLCNSQVINQDRAQDVHPEDRKREPFLCENHAAEGDKRCPWQGWVSPNPVSVALIFWRSPDGQWYICAEKRGIQPGLGQYGFPAGFVEPGHDGPQTARKETYEEVGLEILADEWTYVTQVTSPTNPFLLLTFYAAVLTGQSQPELVPDGTETLEVTWHPLGDPLNWAWPWQAELAAAYAARLPS